LKILLDENVDNRIKDFLESKGFDVETTYEKDLDESNDKELLETALENREVILTHDDDFLGLVDRKKLHPTILFLPQRIRFREMKRRLETLEDFNAKNQVIYP